MAEYNRRWRAGKRRNPERRRPSSLRTLIVDVLETQGRSMTSQQIVDEVIRIRPAANPASIQRALFRLDEVENFEQLGERRWRLN